MSPLELDQRLVITTPRGSPTDPTRLEIGVRSLCLELPHQPCGHPRRWAWTVARMDRPILLETGGGPERFGVAGRWSILTAQPRAWFEITANAWRFVDPTGRVESGDDQARVALRHLIRWAGLDAATNSHVGPAATPTPLPPLSPPPFAGGLAGFIGYDFGALLERVPRRAPRRSDLPDVALGLYDTLVAIDHQRHTTTLWAFDLLGEGPRHLQHRLEAWKERLLDAHEALSPPPPHLDPVRPDRQPEEHCRAVARAIEYIHAGDIFQVNLAQRFHAAYQGDPLWLHERLMERAPAPFAAFVGLSEPNTRRGHGWHDRALVSASPEWFYTVTGDRIVTRPIKGTRPRHPNPDEDRAEAEALLNSPKDRAELTMIVDLERNDLGKVCIPGGVRVREPLTLESHAQVHHLVATVEGTLKPNADPATVLEAMFPGGSITGAPKIRAMQIIDELEPVRRGPYTGAIGWIGRGGSARFNIAIRTAIIERDQVSFQVGGGIVADSDPQAEYEETLHKARGLLDALTLPPPPVRGEPNGLQ
ncbi:para-aminobenzoate synthase, subunit I [Isosphaera pallida ATCC 43644]|uniref:aminodeoxychorismate synthase n=2 Tax=Isosphaera pallida TaxID=128 RepID=E8QZS9_ISOPI|nr:para-aminobenzoate synthase, subunit I [Isosphaera pallida ATCC 43644]